MRAQLNSQHACANFVISSGNPIKDADIATEFFGEVVPSLSKQKIPFSLNVQTGSIDILLEVAKTVGETIKNISENQSFASVVGSVATGIISSAMNWHYRHKKEIKEVRLNKNWRAWEIIHTRVMENLDGWELSALSQTQESMRLEFRKKNSDEKKKIVDQVSDYSGASDSELPRKDIEKQFGYCVKCKTKRQMLDVRSVIMKNGREALQGRCAVCHTRIYKIGATKKQAHPSIEFTTSIESTREKLLYSSGVDLEWAVLNSLKVLGLNVTASPDHSVDAMIDFETKSKYKSGLIEIKRSRDAIGMNVLRQIHSITLEYSNDIPAKGILIVNQFVDEPYPRSRNQRMTLNFMQKSFAEKQRICVIPTCVLYEALDNTRRALRGRQLERKIIETDGILDSI